jgi:hypothetical protein
MVMMVIAYLVWPLVQWVVGDRQRDEPSSFGFAFRRSRADAQTMPKAKFVFLTFVTTHASLCR